MGLIPAPRPFYPIPRKNGLQIGRLRADLTRPKGKGSWESGLLRRGAGSARPGARGRPLHAGGRLRYAEEEVSL